MADKELPVMEELENWATRAQYLRQDADNFSDRLSAMSEELAEMEYRIRTAIARNTAEAHWEGLAHGVFQCSSCRNSISVGTPFIDEETAQRWLSMYRYCPHCGAKMGKEQNK